jgi:2-(1,2-epoxy-1,2-dihydrophenyl)acetyl-CoA isomerase
MEAIRYEVDEGVATLTLNRPAQKNAIDQTMRNELAEVVRDLKHDREVRALVLTGAGGAFCAGGDLRFIASAGLTAEAWRTRFQDLHAWLADLIALDRPVIAAVDGPAFGAGFSLALTADIVLASPAARFCMSFMRVGLAPDFGAYYTLPRVVGVQRAKELMLSAREVDAEEAKRLGLVMEIHPAESLLARAQAMAASFAQAAPVAVGLVKRALAGNTHGDLAAALEIEANGQPIALTTDAHREAVQRFLDKQPPSFRWPA